MERTPNRPHDEVAAARLASAVGDEVGGLRRDLRAALDASEAHERDGREDLAIAALEEQRESLAEVYARLVACIADAAVEREASEVLAAAAEQVAVESAARDEASPHPGCPAAVPASAPGHGATHADQRAHQHAAGGAGRLLVGTAAALVAFVLVVGAETLEAGGAAGTVAAAGGALVDGRSPAGADSVGADVAVPRATDPPATVGPATGSTATSGVSAADGARGAHDPAGPVAAAAASEPGIGADALTAAALQDGGADNVLDELVRAATGDAGGSPSHGHDDEDDVLVVHPDDEDLDVSRTVPGDDDEVDDRQG